jgi:hypothetical protein
LWTVQERLRVVTHYIAHVADDGPDFSIGEYHFSQYVDLVADEFLDAKPIGEVGGQPMVIRPLLGVHAQLLERVCTDAGEWLIGAMACRIEEQGEQSNPAALIALDEVASLDWIKGRIAKLRGLPESEFEQVYMAYAAQPGLSQFFRIEFGDEGIVCLPIDDKEAGIPPARFRALSCVSQTTRSLFA